MLHRLIIRCRLRAKLSFLKPYGAVSCYAIGSEVPLLQETGSVDIWRSNKWNAFPWTVYVLMDFTNKINRIPVRTFWFGRA